MLPGPTWQGVSDLSDSNGAMNTKSYLTILYCSQIPACVTCHPKTSSASSRRNVGAARICVLCAGLRSRLSPSCEAAQVTHTHTPPAPSGVGFSVEWCNIGGYDMLYTAPVGLTIAAKTLCLQLMFISCLQRPIASAA